MITQNTNTLSQEPLTRDSITTTEFNSIMEKGLLQAKSDQSHPVTNVLADLKQMDME